MKNHLRASILLCCLALLTGLFASPAQAQLSGTRSVGPAGDYATLTAAIADVQTQGVNGALFLELQPDSTSAWETFPLTFTNLTGASAVLRTCMVPAAVPIAAPQLNAVGAVVGGEEERALDMDRAGSGSELRDEWRGGAITALRLPGGESDARFRPAMSRKL